MTIRKFTVIASRLLCTAIWLSNPSGAVGAANEIENQHKATVTPGDQFQAFAPPVTDSQPVVVQSRFHLIDIYAIHDETEEFAFRGILSLSWQDDRLAFTPVGNGFGEKVYQGDYQVNEEYRGWYPDVIVTNISSGDRNKEIVIRVQPSGRVIMTADMLATAKTSLQLRRFPFDQQRLDAVFGVVGFDSGVVILQADSDAAVTVNEGISIPEWDFSDVSASTREIPAPYSAEQRAVSGFAISIGVERDPLFMLRLVVLPLIIIVMLSWSVFWMDASSVGDRAAVSFVGILTAVTFMILINNFLPQISYATWMTSMLSMSFIVMATTVVINLMVGLADRTGNHELGNLIDRRCRLIYPLVYFGLTLFLLFAVW